MKIRYKLIMGFLAIAFLISLAGYLAIVRSQEALQKSIEESSMTLAAGIMDEIETNIFQRIESLEGYCNDTVLQECIKASNQAYEELDNIQEYIHQKNQAWILAPKSTVTPFMQGLLNRKTAVELREVSEYYRQKYGYEVFGEIVVTNKYGAIAAQTEKAADFRQDDKKWWQEMKKNDLAIGDVIYDESSNIYALEIGIRINDKNGHFIGAMRAVLNIEDIARIIKKFETIRLHKKQRAFYKLIDQRGRLLYSTDEFTMLEDNSRLLSRIENHRQRQTFVFLAYNARHGEMLSGHAHSRSHLLGMVFMVDHETKAIFAPVNKLKRDILIVSLAVTLLAVLMGAFFSISISRPVTTLTDAATRIGMGSLDTRIEVRAKGEIGQLAASLQKMTQDLKKSTVSKNYVDNIISTMADSLIVVSPEAAIIMVNQATLDLLGYTRDELLNQPIGMIFTEEREEDLLFGLLFGDPEHGTGKQVIANEEKTYLSKGGRKIPVLFSGSVMRDSDGKVEGIVCIAMDITEQKRAEEKLRFSAEEVKEANEELKSFAYIVSHDLRVPLVNIKGFSDELSLAVKEGLSVIEKYLPRIDEEDRETLSRAFKEDMPEALEFIRSSVQRMDRQINSILKLSRLGHREHRLELVDTGAVVQSIVKTMAHQLEQCSAQVIVGKLPEIVVDRTDIEQIMGNLLDNAIKYFHPDRPLEIEMSAECSHEETIFHFRDNGRGIAEDDIHKVFEIFRRAGVQDKPGEGMGLAYVKTLLRRHGGHIWCESKLGAGTTFSFAIPRKTLPCREAQGAGV
ncbi:MAG: ATP-binding protein [bacterium]